MLNLSLQFAISEDNGYDIKKYLGHCSSAKDGTAAVHVCKALSRALCAAAQLPRYAMGAAKLFWWRQVKQTPLQGS